jgi:hypothetical protein
MTVAAPAFHVVGHGTPPSGYSTFELFDGLDFTELETRFKGIGKSVDNFIVAGRRAFTS